VIRVRSNYRHEDVYLYRTMASPAQARTRFLEYVNAMNELRDDPHWYNAVTSNCTTNIRTQRAVKKRAAVRNAAKGIKKIPSKRVAAAASSPDSMPLAAAHVEP